MTYAGQGRLRYRAALVIWFSLYSSACLDDAKAEHDDGRPKQMDAGVPPGSEHDGGAIADDEQDAATGDPDDNTNGDDDDDDNNDVPEQDAGADSDPDPDPPAALIAGTAIEAGCSSSQAPAEGMCGGYYCGVDEATLTPAIDPESKCGGDPALACSGTLTTAVAACAREVKSAMPWASNATLRPMIQACVYEDDAFQEVPEDCLGCFLDVAACASDNCLAQCFAGDSEVCDECQIDNDCTVPFFTCGGMPSPF